LKKIGVKYQILLIALVPALLVNTFLTYSHFRNNVDHAYDLLQSNNRIFAQQLASASELNMLSGHYEPIQHLLNKTIDTNAIILASAYNENGKAIATSVSKEYDSKNTNSYFYYRLPIISQTLQETRSLDLDQSYKYEGKVIGWVHLNMSHRQFEIIKANIWNDSISLFFVILCILLMLSFVIGSEVTRPIFKLLEHIKKVEKGQLGEVIISFEKSEIGELQKGFNQMTESLLANRNELNEKIQFATKQLSEAIGDLESKNSELKLAKDEAQNANEIKSIFLTNMSHEIRTPINGIKGFINLISQSDLNPTQKRYADIILKSTNDLTDIISEILDFSKMESGKLQIVDGNFDLYEAIQQTRDILFINVLSKNIDLVLIIYSDTPQFVCGDKLRLKQVLLNLIGNAIKFTDEGEVVIRVAVEQQTESDVNILITIEDTGIGISEDDQKNLFEAFRQVETASNRRFKGTGLGLVISRNLVGLMAGEISMQSKIGVGTKFSVHLPFLLTSMPKDIKEIPLDNKIALILSSRKTCLQEIISLFDRAEIATESMFLSGSDSAESINSKIQKFLRHIDFLVIDLRHFNFDLKQMLKNISMDQTRIIVMHYDQTMVKTLWNLNLEFISATTNSQNLQKSLSSPLVNISTKISSIPSLPSSSKTVLLVDDNQINLKLASELIGLWGHQVYEAESALEAMALYKKESFDLIVLDIQMPEIDGVELLKMMRIENKQDQTPTVALTANILDNEEQRLLTLGFDYYLSKPIDEEKFRRILDSSSFTNTDFTKLEKVTVTDQSIVVPSSSFDFKQSLKLSQNNKVILCKILEILIRDIPNLQLQLKSAAFQNDKERLSAILHKLHGTTCYISLPKLKKLVTSLQQLITTFSNRQLQNTTLKIHDELFNIQNETRQLLIEMEKEENA
jgi:two-component system sensor histidine kinase BarA|tara:strand:+ start:5393 stop:8131 length:2739 start_codon:yes stop_codon:yes gene_type:complete